MRVFDLLRLAALLGSAIWLRAPLLAAEPDPIDQYLEDQMQRRHLPGLSLAVVKDGQLIKSRGYGVADVGQSTPATADTVYHLASATKPFTATGIMLLTEDGRIGLDDPITKYIDDLPIAWHTITIRQLLSHTSGIPSYLRSRNVKWDQDYTPQEVVKIVADSPLNFPPGERWEYSNTGYVLLAMIIEKVTGRPYDRFLTERVFNPLGMTATQRSDPAAVPAEAAKGYQWEQNRVVTAEHLNPTLWDNGDGGIMSSVADLAKFDVALADGHLLRDSTLKQMWTETKLNDGYQGRTLFDDGYGLGWFLDYYRGHRLIWHSGGRPGSVCVISRFVDDGLTVIILANLDGWNPKGIARGVASFYVPALAPPSLMQPHEDTEPQTTEKLHTALRDLAHGRKDRSLMTPGLTAAVLEKGDSELADLLKTVKSFDFLNEDNIEDRRIELDGSHVTRIRYYQLSGGAKPSYGSFFLTADGKVASAQTSPD